MKGLRVAGLALALLLGLVLGSWLFFPWQQATQVAFETVAQRLAGRGIELSVSDVVAEGGTRFQLRGLALDHPFLSLKATSVAGRLQIFASLLSLAPVVDVRLGPGEVLLAQGSRTSWRSGAFQLRVRADAVQISRLDVVGDVGLKGDVTYSLASSSLGATALELSLPSEWDDLLSGLRALLPLRKEAEGRWKVEKP